MNIYLSIIIGYILFRVTRFFIKYKNISRILELKKISINGNIFVIKKITPLDFENGFPFTFFELSTGLDVANQLRKNPNKIEEKGEEIKRTINIAKILFEKSVVYAPLGINKDSLYDSPKLEAIKIGINLYKNIIEYNFRTINKVYKLNKIQALHVAELCHTFGKTPSEHLFNKNKLSVIEKYIIDEFFYNIWLDRQNEQIKAQEARK